MQSPLTTRIAFTDSSGEQSTLRQLLRSSLLLGLGALAVLFGFSYLLSGLAVRRWSARGTSSSALSPTRRTS